MFAAAAASAPDRLAVDVADAMALKAKAAGGDRAALVGAARQFEAMLVAQMLKGMRETRFSSEDDPLNSGEGLKLYRDLLDQQWATQIAKGRGLGFADMMVKALERTSGQAATPPLPAAEDGGEGGLKEAVGAACAPQTCPADTPAPAPRASSPAAGGASADPRRAFLEKMRPHAESAAAATGVPAPFILAQAALESGWGRREIKGEDGQPSHNLFGIKAGRAWDGAVAETLTTEYRQGVPMKLSQRFRAYADYGSAFTDYANLLKARYGEAVRAGDDAAGFARGLAAGGYATDPAYADKLQSTIARVHSHLALAAYQQ
ncbi:MAG: flagellar assembly peptidoglycan hydrolase FlgJ [Pseudomonadota bacterium]